MKKVDPSASMRKKLMWRKPARKNVFSELEESINWLSDKWDFPRGPREYIFTPSVRLDPNGNQESFSIAYHPATAMGPEVMRDSHQSLWEEKNFFRERKSRAYGDIIGWTTAPRPGKELQKKFLKKRAPAQKENYGEFFGFTNEIRIESKSITTTRNTSLDSTVLKQKKLFVHPPTKTWYDQLKEDAQNQN
jgi:hypothetical protein